MAQVRVLAGATVPFVKRSDVHAETLAARAALAAMSEAGVTPDAIGEVYVATVFGGSLIGQRAMRYAGLTGHPVVNIENACASGGTALHLAARAIADERTPCALVVGVDKLSTFGSGTLPQVQTEWEAQAGATMPVVYAMRAQRYMHEHGATRGDLAGVSVKSHRFASENPVAQFREPWTVDDVLNSRPVADPLTLYQCSPKSDGAAAVILGPEDLAKELGFPDAPRVRASVVTSGIFSTAQRDICRPDISVRASTAAYEQAGLGPADIDVAEVHDAFTIAELIYYEELGFTDRGGGVDYLHSGRSSSLTAGKGPVVNPSGGLLGRGHPVGATGVAQAVECWEQLLGRAGPRQREDVNAALAHVTGGGISGFDNGACAVSIFTRD